MVYHLTEKGRSFFPVVASVIEWGQRWFQSPEGLALKQEHVVCGRVFHPRLMCDHCHERLRGSSVQVVRGAADQQTAG